MEAVEDIKVRDPETLLEIWWRGGGTSALLELAPAEGRGGELAPLLEI